ncbi:hypothetical protein, partial [Hymenobacter montanus]|uniref:hypothetical protein n=1 Tax=Hymenobacter montanus TaxID=2771359 RepID=UPI001CC2DBE6
GRVGRRQPFVNANRLPLSPAAGGWRFYLFHVSLGAKAERLTSCIFVAYLIVVLRASFTSAL